MEVNTIAYEQQIDYNSCHPHKSSNDLSTWLQALNLIHKKYYFKTMIKFIRLLFYHIYIYYDRKEGKAIAKFTTFLVFSLLLGMILYSGYVILYTFNNNTIINTPYIYYISFFIIIGCLVGIYVYSGDFENFDSFIDYRVKYYFYFFLIAGFAVALAFYAASINRKKIFDKRMKENEKVWNIGIPTSPLNVL